MVILRSIGIFQNYFLTYFNNTNGNHLAEWQVYWPLYTRRYDIAWDIIWEFECSLQTSIEAFQTNISWNKTMVCHNLTIKSPKLQNNTVLHFSSPPTFKFLRMRNCFFFFLATCGCKSYPTSWCIPRQFCMVLSLVAS